MQAPTQSIAALMASLRQGDQESTRQLFQLLYPELRRLAGSKMRGERSGHTWQPTALVNELYLELIKIKSLRGSKEEDFEAKESFLRLAAFLMRRLLIHHARPLSKQAEKVEIDSDVFVVDADNDTLADIESALSRLAGIDPLLRTVVEMRVFEECTIDEIAERLKCSPRSVNRYWRFAQRWLYEALAGVGRQSVADSIGLEKSAAKLA